MPISSNSKKDVIFILAVLVAIFIIIKLIASNDEKKLESPPTKSSELSSIESAQMIVLGEEYVKRRLKDPDSAKFQNQFIGKRGFPCGEVNSKNGFGGFTGYKRYIVVSAELTVIEGENMELSEFDTSWNEGCK